ncbi:MAG: GTP-binding protein [Myxococcota bacterium]
MDLLRFSTAGSVDDGKSTLIGRLLMDTKNLFEDQLEAVEKASRRRGQDAADLALLTDGLKAEREQGITIDVAYRYFATPKRKFIIADTPGHTQYTRNMVTGASTASLAVVLVDARKGVVEQTCRHAFISSLLGIQHIILAVNKMDLVDHEEARFAAIVDEFEAFASRLDVAQIDYIPISALLGDNVAHRSTKMDWYQGPTLLHQLETVRVTGTSNTVDARCAVQYVVRPQTTEHHDFRGYAGAVIGGAFRPGDEVLVLPSGFESKVESIYVGEDRVEESFAPMSVTMTLSDDIDISRGDMICKPGNQPSLGQDLDVMLCWFSSQAKMKAGSKYLVRHTSREAQCIVHSIEYRVDVNTLHRQEDVEALTMNDVARAKLRVSRPLAFDPYRRNRTTGAIVLIDPFSHDTVAAGMIRG